MCCYYYQSVIIHLNIFLPDTFHSFIHLNTHIFFEYFSRTYSSPFPLLSLHSFIQSFKHTRFKWFSRSYSSSFFLHFSFIHSCIHYSFQPLFIHSFIHSQLLKHISLLSSNIFSRPYSNTYFVFILFLLYNQHRTKATQQFWSGSHQRVFFSVMWSWMYFRISLSNGTKSFTYRVCTYPKSKSIQYLKGFVLLTA